MPASAESLTLTIRRRPLAVALAWVSCVAMLAVATSLVGLFVAPLVVPAVTWVITRRRTAWAVRVPLMIGDIALILLLGAGLGAAAG